MNVIVHHGRCQRKPKNSCFMVAPWYNSEPFKEFGALATHMKPNLTAPELSPLGLLPSMPMDPAWLEQHEAAFSAEPRLFKAAFKLLVAAWRGLPTGTIPASHSYMVELTGLSPALVDQHYATLTDGFSLGEDGRLTHGAMRRMADSLIANHGQAIEAYARSLMLAAQSPDEFCLTSVDAAPRRLAKGKTALPKDFSLDVGGLEGWCIEQGYVEPRQRFELLAQFKDRALSRDERYKDWPGAFRNFVRNAPRFGNAPSAAPRHQAPRSLSASAGGYNSARNSIPPRQLGPIGRGEEAAQQAASLFNVVEARRMAVPAQQRGAL